MIADSIKNESTVGIANYVRYSLAKKKMDRFFVKWLFTNQEKVEELLKLASEQSSQLFPSKANLSATLNNASSINFGLNNTITPPRRMNENLDGSNRKSFHETLNPTTHLAKSAYLGKSAHLQIKIDTDKIPQFYYPEGKPLDQLVEAEAQDYVKKIFDKKQEIAMPQVQELVQKVLSLPCYFAPLFMSLHAKSAQKLTKAEFQKYWKQFGSKEISKRAFALLSGDKSKRYLTIENFKQLLKIILDTHPGLEFLQQTPEFQEWYSICVINRMFFMANKKNDFKMSYRQFKNSIIMKSLYDIEHEPEINLNRDFFCYEDFYVIYIKFWELDSTHDFLLTKEEFSKYSGYTLSRKAVERIFSQVARKFQDPQKMTFGDFAWFIYCAEDKTTAQSIQYWFKILDLDNNGIVTGYELQFFFEEQNQRLAYMENGSTDFNYENTVCQMVDLLKPEDGLQFTLENFLQRKKEVGFFINILLDLNKMLAYDQRDPYEEKSERNDHPNWSDWDRFVKPEYKRVENAEENQDEEEVLNWENDE